MQRIKMFNVSLLLRKRNVDKWRDRKHTAGRVATYNITHVVRKPAFSIRENKGADLLCGNCSADQGFFFRYIESAIPLPPKSEISRL